MAKLEQPPKAQTIEKLCDQLSTKKRTISDYEALLFYLTSYPKECAPIKAKILQYLQTQATQCQREHLKLLSTCYAQSLVLIKRTLNKNEGPVDAWKSGLLGEVKIFEDNLDTLYQYVGMKASRVVQNSNENHEKEFPDEKVTESVPQFEKLIDNYIHRINWTANNICALLHVPQIELPIPASVVIKLAAKLSSIRWREHKKKPNGLIRVYIFSKETLFIDIFIMMIKALVNSLGTNSIPYVTHINASIFNILETTINDYVKVRLTELITHMLDTFGLNINLESLQIEHLLKNELLVIYSKENQVIATLRCLNSLFNVYQEFLSSELEYKIKDSVVQKCIEIYRDFENAREPFRSAACRRQLLTVLKTIATHPRATSTSELSYHLLELALKLETNIDVKSLINDILKNGLAHRPIIVPHFDVYNIHGRPMLQKDEKEIDNYDDGFDRDPIEVILE